MNVRLEARNIFKSFGPVQALVDVSMLIESREIVGLCGENGAGKSTLIKVLTGVYAADKGRILLDDVECKTLSPQTAQEAGIAFVSQELSIAPQLSVFDNIWLGHRAVPFFHRRSHLRERAVEALRLVGMEDLGLDVAASTLSLGQRQLLEIARALVREAQILFLDEPTATLADQEIRQIFKTLRRLRDEGRSIVYITHRLSEVFELCDSVTVLRNGRIVASQPVSRSSRQQLIESMLGYSLGEIYPERASSRRKRVLEVRDLSVPGLVNPLSFELAQGEILCLAGQIGSGAPDVIRALAGLIYNAEGGVFVEGRRLALGSVPAAMAAGLMFVSEDRATEGIFLKMTVADNLVALWNQMAGGVLVWHRDVARVAGNTAVSVGVDRSRLRDRVADLSGGNQQKIAIGRATVAASRGILLMNEPTRGVDVGARADIYRLMRKLCSQGFSILMSSSDIEEVVGMSDAVITMFRANAVTMYREEEVSPAQIVADIVHQEHASTLVSS
jgi:ABC-type sugar transport system ATPase subunit